MRLYFALLNAISTAKLEHPLRLGSCATNGFRICIYLRPSAVPYFRNGSLMLKYRRRELNNISKINIWCRRYEEWGAERPFEKLLSHRYANPFRLQRHLNKI